MFGIDQADAGSFELRCLTSVLMVVVSSGLVVRTASISLVGHVFLTPSMCSGLANIGHSEFVKLSAVVRGAPATPIGSSAARAAATRLRRLAFHDVAIARSKREHRLRERS